MTDKQLPMKLEKIQIKTIEDLKSIAKIFVDSGIFPEKSDSNLDMARTCVKIMAGQELGLEPFQAMRSIDVFQGQTSFRYQLIGAKVKQSGRYDFKPVEVSAKVAKIQFYDTGKPVYLSEFTMEDAQQQGLAGKDAYKKNPADMLYARALTKGVNKVCPEVMMQPAYVEGDFGEAPIDAESTEVTDPKKPAEEVVASSVPTAPKNGRTAKKSPKSAETASSTSPAAKSPTPSKPSTKEPKPSESNDLSEPEPNSSEPMNEDVVDVSTEQGEAIYPAEEDMIALEQIGAESGWTPDDLNAYTNTILKAEGVDTDDEEAITQAFTFEVYQKVFDFVQANKPEAVNA
jgi:hypothetical protein